MVASGLLFADDVIQNAFVEQIQLRFVPEETGLVYCQVFQQLCEFLFAFRADQQAVVVIERIHAAFAQPPLQSVLKKVSAPGIEIHSAFLIHQCLQKPHFGVAELDGQCWSAHELPCLLSSRSSPAIGVPLGCRRVSLTRPEIQQPVHVEQNNQSSFVLSQSRDAIESIFP